MEHRAWVYVVGDADGRFRVGIHRGVDVESHVAGLASKTGVLTPILWAETFRSPREAEAFTQRFRRWPVRRQAQTVFADQVGTA